MAEEDALYAFQHECGVCADYTHARGWRILKLLKNYRIPLKPNIWLRMPQVSCMIDKLPPSWKDFKHTLKHLKEELTLIELGSHLRIKESLRVQDSDKPKGNNVAGPSVVNMVEHNNSSRLNIVSDNIGSAFMSISKLNNLILWHARLGHVHFKRMQDMSKFYVIEPNDLVAINSIIESRDDIFDEHMFSSVPRPSQRSLTFGLQMDLQKKAKGIDYFDTYALVARISTIRLLITMASIHNLIIHQMVVKTTLLNGELEEEVYMNQPLGFIMFDNENKVCKLIKSLYRLKQAPMHWYQKFDEVVLSNGYLLNQADKCVYSKFDASGEEVIICLYVDDMLIFGIDQVYVDLTKEFLSSSTPLATCEKLMPNRGLAVSQLEYFKVIGCLMYAMTCTRPNIAFAVGKLCSAATLAKASSQMYNEKSRHLGVRHCMIRELITNEVVSIEFVRSQQNLDDHFTKGLARDLVIKSTEGMGLKSN
nr:zinc finger, CCHC-type [Tanacetum cinerariifolium]